MKTFTFKYFYPDTTYERSLKDYADGNMSVYMSAKDESYDDDPALFKDIVHDRHKAMICDNRYIGSGLAEADRPEQIEPGVWCIGLFISDRGQECLDGLLGGFVWDIQEHKVDMVETDRFYRRRLNDNCVPDHVMKLITRMEDPRLEKIRDEMLCFKLTATSFHGNWMI